MSSAAFVIGDWIVYGEDHFRGQQRLPNFESESIGARRVSSEIYNEALRPEADEPVVTKTTPPSVRRALLKYASA